MDAVIGGSKVLLSGAIVTVELFLISAVLMVSCSFAAGICRTVPFLPVRALARCYIELFRGTSLVVQLFWFYYALPFFGLSLDAYVAAALGLGLCFGAYGAEVVRGAIEAVPRQQYEAATALSLSGFERLRVIILPQALLIMIPSFGNLLILMLKSTSAASLITLPELTFQGYALNVRTLATVEIFTAVLIIYFIMASAISFAMRRLELYLGRWRKRV